MKNIAIVEYDHSGNEYLDWFKCTKCKCNRIIYKSNYCPNCGSQLEWLFWSLPIEDLIDNK